jgi:glycosyltransferase involved in cell wall biosynthesis
MDKILTITPVYNKEEFLQNSIESVLQQSHENTELVIIDDCSTDKSLEIAQSYEHLDNVTVLKNKENKGCYYSRNKGLDHFKNKEWDYFTIHDADDISDTTRFETLLNQFEDNTLGLKTTYVRVDRELKPQMTPQGDKVDIYASEGIAIFPRKTFDLLGYYDNTRFSGDTDYWWRLEAYCRSHPDFKVGISEDILYLAINHENNLTKKYNFTHDRPQYWSKSQNDIKTQMLPNDNFYRNIFK